MGGCEEKKRIVVTLPESMKEEVDPGCVEVKFCADTTEPTVCVKDVECKEPESAPDTTAEPEGEGDAQPPAGGVCTNR